jgi:hypothetical protein
MNNRKKTGKLIPKKSRSALSEILKTRTRQRSVVMNSFGAKLEIVSRGILDIASQERRDIQNFTAYIPAAKRKTHVTQRESW